MTRVPVMIVYTGKEIVFVKFAIPLETLIMYRDEIIINEPHMEEIQIKRDRDSFFVSEFIIISYFMN